ncbi:MAG TPA: ATPase [Desulfobulbaceae bacterium]|nr:ATPase [Desulfobulbaceae bacterium]
MDNSCKSCSSEQKSSCGSEQKHSFSSAGADAAMAQQEIAITRSLSKIRNKILVMSGKGGVGKSTVSVNLALGLSQRGYRVGLMDVDLHGPDICRMLNLTGSLQPPKNPTDLVPTLQYNDNLKVVSLEYMMKNRDDAIIWRGPLKIQAIRQFVADMDWGELDYLVVDAPPGTGDEPLSVAQTITNVQALVVTTPQSLALADVRKSLNFCKAVKMPIIGVVENMSGFICPHCGQEVDIFSTGGGEKIAREFDVPFLGRVPMDPRIVVAGDTGNPNLAAGGDTPASNAFKGVVDAVIQRLPADKSAGLNTFTPLNAGCDPNKCGCKS